MGQGRGAYAEAADEDPGLLDDERVGLRPWSP